MAWRSSVDLQTRQMRARAALTVALQGVSDDIAARSPEPGARSILGILAHLVLTERRIAEDMRLMLGQEHPELPSIRQLDEPSRLLALIHQVGSVAGLLAAFDDACRTTLALVEALDEDQELRSGHSPELGNVLLGPYAALNTRYHYFGHIEEIRVARQNLGRDKGELASTSGFDSILPV